MTQTAVENGGLGDISLSRCEISFLMNVTDVDDLGEALDVAAINIGRFGLDSFFVVATDPDSGREWIIHSGQVHTRQELDATRKALRETLDSSEQSGDDDLDEDPNEDPDGDATQ